MLELVQFIAVLACLIFAGAALYITLVEHPARLECGTELAATVFAPSYNRALLMQATLALVATVAAVAAWYMGDSVIWLVGALCIFFVVPFTLIALRPINKKLKRADLNKSSEATRRLLQLWGKLHCVRSVASIIAACIFLYTVVST